MKKTIVDVASLAGVSIATVSRVINNNYPVNKKTKERVLEAIHELQFVPNVQAQEVKKRKTKTVGVVVPSVDNIFFSEVVHGIERQLNDSSYSQLLMFSKNDEMREQECIRNLIARNVAAIIVVDAHTSNIQNGFYKKQISSIPIVFINGDASKHDHSHVSSDEVFGANAALQHLWDKGHEFVYFVRGESSYSYDVKEKVYLDFYKQKGIDASKNIISIGDGNSTKTIESTASMFDELLKSKRCSAAFCCNDLMAIGVLEASRQLGMKIPQDFSLVGFDNSLLSKYSNPRLTTVDQHMHQLGYSAAQLVLEMIGQEKQISKKIILGTALIQRDSVMKYRRR